MNRLNTTKRAYLSYMVILNSKNFGWPTIDAIQYINALNTFPLHFVRFSTFFSYERIP